MSRRERDWWGRESTSMWEYHERDYVALSFSILWRLFHVSVRFFIPLTLTRNISYKNFISYFFSAFYRSLNFSRFPIAIVLLFLILRTASRKCFGCKGPVSPKPSATSNAVSTTSPTKTLAIPLIAITTFWDTEQPVIVCIRRLTGAFGNAARLYISYLSSCSSVKFDTRTLKQKDY